MWAWVSSTSSMDAGSTGKGDQFARRNRDRGIWIHTEEIVYTLLLTCKRRADDGGVVLRERLWDAEERLFRSDCICLLCFLDECIDTRAEVGLFLDL